MAGVGNNKLITTVGQSQQACKSVIKEEFLSITCHNRANMEPPPANYHLQSSANAT